MDSTSEELKKELAALSTEVATLKTELAQLKASQKKQETFVRV